MKTKDNPECQELHEITNVLWELGVLVSFRELAIYQLHNPIDLDLLLPAGPQAIKRWFIESEKLVSRKAERLRQRLNQLGLCPVWEDVCAPAGPSLDELLRLPDPDLKREVEQIIARGYRDEQIRIEASA